MIIHKGAKCLPYNLPNPSLITEQAITAEMISISSQGLCGEDDFRCRIEKESIISGVKERNYSVS
jgi:hypothetical protein